MCVCVHKRFVPTLHPTPNTKEMIYLRSMLAPDPVYDAYVSAAGITGIDDFDIVGNYSCGVAHQPCTNFPIVSVSAHPPTHAHTTNTI